MSDERISLGRERDTPSKSLAGMLHSQYTSRELNDIWAGTEIREYEVITASKLFTSRVVELMLSTEESDLEGLDGEERNSVLERLAIRKKMTNNDNAMSYIIHDSFLYAFGLIRISYERKSRSELIRISNGPQANDAESVGIKDKLLTKLGVSKKFKTEYISKE
jgi:hypothetical protein